MAFHIYRYKCGYSPCIIIQKDTLLQGSGHECELHFPAFENLMKELQVQRGENGSLPLQVGRVQSAEYLFVPA